jgi:SAM-dependent methyltransferase
LSDDREEEGATRTVSEAYVLEAGCGVGAQTVTLARWSPDARFTSVDISAASVAEARKTTDAAGLTNVHVQQADIFALPFAAESFDHVFVCFVLEHLSRPVEALAILKRLLKAGGTMTVIEGDHGSAYFHPDSSAAHKASQCQVELQRLAGGNALVGRQLYPLMIEAGLEAVHVSLRTAYVDSSRPDLVDRAKCEEQRLRIERRSAQRRRRPGLWGRGNALRRLHGNEPMGFHACRSYERRELRYEHDYVARQSDWTGRSRCQCRLLSDGHCRHMGQPEPGSTRLG